MLLQFDLFRSIRRRNNATFRSNIYLHPRLFSKFLVSTKKFSCLRSFHARFVHTVRVTVILAKAESKLY